MSDDDIPDLAAEYVLGLASAEDRARAEDRIARDHGFAAQVAAWQARLSALDDEYGTRTPPEAVLVRVEARLFGTPAEATRIGRRPLRPAAGRPARRRVIGLLAGLAAAVAVGALVLVTRPDAPGPQTILAELSAPDLRIAVHRDDAGLIFERLSQAADPAGRSYELWLIRDGAARSLGLLAPGLTQVGTELHMGDVVAVSLEPEGGSPGAGPSGPVLASAQITGL